MLCFGDLSSSYMLSMNLSHNLCALNENGYCVINSALSDELVTRLIKKTNYVYHAEKLLNYVGIGNKPRLGGNSFSGNLILKSDVYIDLLLVLSEVNASLGMESYCLSEYFLVSNISNEDHSAWWHRDHPYTDQNISSLGSSSIGYFVPLGGFNEDSGSTLIIPGSHDNSNLSPENTKPIAFTASAGDLIVYDPRALHTGGRNKTGLVRHLLIVLFNRKEFIPAENFERQLQLSYKKTSRSKLYRVKIKRHKLISNFFSRNKNLWHTSLRPIKALQVVAFRTSNKLISFLYYGWTRSLYRLTQFLGM